MVTEASTNSVCSSEGEYKECVNTCKSYLLNNKLQVLQERDDEAFDEQNKATSISLPQGKALKLKEIKLRKRIEEIKLSIK